jgi:hypothetical protein
VFQVKYAYKPMHTWSGDRYHAANMRLEGRTASLARAAAEHHIKQGNRFFVWGDFEEGDQVFQVKGDLVPSTMHDRAHPPHSEQIGMLFKVNGRWTIEQSCPSHRWHYDASRGGEPAKACLRCGRFEYVDADLQSAHEAQYPEAA